MIEELYEKLYKWLKSHKKCYIRINGDGFGYSIERKTLLGWKTIQRWTFLKECKREYELLLSIPGYKPYYN